MNGQGPELIEHDEEVGFELIMADDIDDLGTDEIVKHIRQRIGDSPVYLRCVLNNAPLITILMFIASRLSFDIDTIGLLMFQLIVHHCVLTSLW